MSLSTTPDPAMPYRVRKRSAWALSLLVPALEADAYYRHVTCALVPLLWAAYLPQLPNGCFGMFTVAYFPPLWFALMDARLVEAVHSDPACINFHPRRHAAPMRRHGLVDFPARAA